MKDKIEVDLEKAFKFVMENFYDNRNYQYYNTVLLKDDKIKIVQYLLEENSKDAKSKINHKEKADKILSAYYHSNIKGNEFITKITDKSLLTQDEKEYIDNFYDIDFSYLLYKQKNIRVIAQLGKDLFSSNDWSVTLLDNIYEEELTQKQKYQVYKDIYEMLFNEC